MQITIKMVKNHYGPVLNSINNMTNPLTALLIMKHDSNKPAQRV